MKTIFIFLYFEYQNEYDTPLYYACINDIKVVECLIKHGAQVDVQNKVTQQLLALMHG